MKNTTESTTTTTTSSKLFGIIPLVKTNKTET